MSGVTWTNVRPSAKADAALKEWLEYFYPKGGGDAA